MKLRFLVAKLWNVERSLDIAHETVGNLHHEYLWKFVGIFSYFFVDEECTEDWQNSFKQN